MLNQKEQLWVLGHLVWLLNFVEVGSDWLCVSEWRNFLCWTLQRPCLFWTCQDFKRFNPKMLNVLRWLTYILKLKFNISIQYIIMSPCYFANISGSTYFAPSGRVPGLRRCWIRAFFRCFFSSRIRFAEICNTKNNRSSCLITFLKRHIF